MSTPVIPERWQDHYACIIDGEVDDADLEKQLIEELAAAEARNRELEAEWVTKMAMREDGADVRAGTTCKFSSQHHLGQCPHCGEDGRITNGEFYEALEILGHETVEDCPLSEEQIENLAKTLKTLAAERDQLREQLEYANKCRINAAIKATALPATQNEEGEK